MAVIEKGRKERKLGEIEPRRHPWTGKELENKKRDDMSSLPSLCAMMRIYLGIACLHYQAKSKGGKKGTKSELVNVSLQGLRHRQGLHPLLLVWRPHHTTRHDATRQGMTGGLKGHSDDVGNNSLHRFACRQSHCRKH